MAQATGSKRTKSTVSETIQVEGSTQEKKIRLEKKKATKEETLILDLSVAQLDKLILLENSLPVSLNVAEQAISRLLKYAKIASENAVRCKLIMLIGHLSQTPGFDCLTVLSKLKTLLEAEKSHTVISQYLDTLTTIGEIVTESLNDNLENFLSIAVKYLSNPKHSVRCKALKLLGTLGCPNKEITVNVDKDVAESTTAHDEYDICSNLESIVISFFKDQDSRVRVEALGVILSWHMRGIPLSPRMYKDVCATLSDDYEKVRFMAARLICVLCHLYPEENVTVSNESKETSDKVQLRLTDDGFAKLCQLLSTDVNMKVRAEAAMLLGSLHKVDFVFLEQTLDKILMSGLRRKTSAHERQRMHFQTGEWSTGKKWADDAPKEELNPDDVRLISLGACGAFVHGLEDEFVEVRNATVDAICELAANSPRFAVLSQDSLLDMMNDEIEDVRMNAVHSLTKVACHISLREDQVEAISGCLKDYSTDIRKALHEMFSRLRVTTKVTLKMLIEELLNNLKKYPQDRLSIWKCMQNMGKVNSNMVQCIVPYLLHLHPYFDTPEPDINDPAYVAVLLLVLNSASCHEAILSLLPHHTMKHYRYLKASNPDLLPNELRLDHHKHTQTNRDQISSEATSSSYLKQVVEHIPNLEKMDLPTAEKFVDITRRDLLRISSLEPSNAATAEFMVIFLECIGELVTIFQSSTNLAADLSLDHQRQHIQGLLEKIIEKCTCMQQLFLGISEKDNISVLQLKLCAQSIQLCSFLQTRADCKSLCIKFLKIVSDFKGKLSSCSFKPSRFTLNLLKNLKKFESCDPNVFRSTLLPLLSMCRQNINVLQVNNTLHKIQASIQEPQDSSDVQYKFTCGLITSIPVHAIIEEIEDPSRIRIQVTYPDQQRSVIIPRLEDFRQISPSKYNLKTKALLCHSAWTDAAHVEIAVVLIRDTHDELLVSKLKDRTNQTLELCDVVKVKILPDNVRKT
ncbi:DgyrCDS4360 [Dimorphilus gyrociliatus]|uniref:DgyrCDS4360 n=1 Tax=Dimorphilus gyrociliatus TaxID=2664684 RepID=A0A7I8VGF9_9ANNE|nr:DgyrCDS4360 [Dimorphilus gyrociliatus]